MQNIFELKTDEQRLGRLYFDLPGEKVNLFNEQVFDEFEKTLDYLEKLDLKALLLFSRKEDVFIAGADVYAFRKINTLEVGWQAARRGQLLFERWHRLPFPTIAVINGACMGGGTELSLACTCRLASDHPKTKIGLPEVRLGILPGWGGTQRLPKLIGLTAALKMILSGKPFNARQALKMGLVQKIISAQNFEQQALQFAQQILEQKELCQPQKPSFLEKLPLTRQLILKKARIRVLKETHGFYPAPLMAIEVIAQTWHLPIEQGLEIEAKALAELIVTPQSKNLVDLFIWSEEIKKQVRQEYGLSDLPALKQIAFAGTEQKLIDLYLSLLRKEVKLIFLEENSELFKTIKQAIERELRKLEIRKKISLAEHKNYLQNISQETSVKSLDRRTLIVVNKYLVNQKRLLKDKMILLSNLVLKDENVSALIRNGLPVFNYFYWQKQNFTVEILLIKKTNPEALKNALNSFLDIKLVPIISSTYPFGLVQWLLTILFSEAIQLVRENFSMSQIDVAMEIFGWQKGPFQLMWKIGQNSIAAQLRSMLKYDPQKEILLVFNVQELLHGLTGGKLTKQVSRRKDGMGAYQYIQQRLNLLLVNWAAHFLNQGKIQTAEELNLLSVSALGFPPFHGGLIRWMEAQEADQILNRLQSFEAEAGLRYKPTVGLLKLLGQ